jgi:hypothetical protein
LVYVCFSWVVARAIFLAAVVFCCDGFFTISISEMAIARIENGIEPNAIALVNASSCARLGAFVGVVEGEAEFVVSVGCAGVVVCGVGVAVGVGFGVAVGAGVFVGFVVGV